MKFVPATPFREAYHSILGQIAVAMGQVENRINVLLIQMLDQNMWLATNLTFGYHLDRVLEVLKAVFYSKHQNAETVLVFEYLLGQLNRLHAERNKNFHCAWNFDDTSKTANRFRVAKQKKGIHRAPDWENVPLDDLQSLNAELYEVIDQINAFATKFYRNPKTPLTTEQEQLVDNLIHKMLKEAKRSGAAT